LIRPLRLPLLLPAALLFAALSVAAATPTSATTGGAANTVLADVERLFHGGQTAQALLRADQALQADPGNAGLRFLKGVMLSDSGRSTEAMAQFERMTQDFPEMPEPYNNLAVLEAAAGRLDQARSLLDTALRHDPAYRTAHENLGDVLMRLAQRAYEAASGGGRNEPGLQRKLRLVRDFNLAPR
jgi:Flp pilus assembly protein TadD